jgi:hypothetical protein
MIKVAVVIVAVLQMTSLLWSVLRACGMKGSASNSYATVAGRFWMLVSSVVVSALIFYVLFVVWNAP